MLNKEFIVKENLLTHKNIEPLDQISIDELKKIQALDVSNFSEADVREEIINPIIKILGYRKGQFASVDREKHIKFLNKSRFIDYKITLWEENFWIIEAKKPLDGDSFGYEELKQVTEYSIHPDINATIVVLCDGRKLELFDREDSLETPILSFKIKELTAHIDSLRKILCPMQIWFFYKRRVLRAIDKAFEKEFNQKRANEFLKIIENRFREKKIQILKNFKSNQYTDKSIDEGLLSANFEEIIDNYYFYTYSIPTMLSMNAILVDEYINKKLIVLNKIFPDYYRNINDAYYVNALSFLLQLEKKLNILNWVPASLVKNGDNTTNAMIKSLIKYTLTYFEDDVPRRIILLASATFRRIYKILYISQPELREACELNHLLTRYVVSESSWIQILSSPESSIIHMIDISTSNSTDKFVKEFVDDEGYRFNSNLAKQRLEKLWLIEKTLLQKISNYSELRKEANVRELYPTELSSVAYDNLGHLCLCVLKDSEEWKRYVLANHKNEVENLALTGLWAAEEILKENILSDIPFDKGKYFAERFFFGDSDTQSILYTLYNK